MNDFYVYAYFENGIPFYIGKGKDNRAYEHLFPCNLEKKTLFYNKLNKMLRENLPFEVKKLHENLTEVQAFQLEIQLIKLYGRRDSGTGTLCNHTDGGEGQSGQIVCKDNLAKMRDRNLGKEASFDTRIKMSDAKIGIVHSLEAIERLRQTKTELYGVPVESYDLRTKKTIKRYPSQAAVKLDGFNAGNVYCCVVGHRRSHKGLGWRRA